MSHARVTDVRAEGPRSADSGPGAIAERDSNRIVEAQLDERADALEQAAKADVITYLGPMYAPGDDIVKDLTEVIATRRRTLMVILETAGGYVTVAERIARIFRHHYRRLHFVVPTYAMSAGTVLVMAGDAIWMDYASTLGPIDPQVMNRSGQWVPALGYLEQYARLVEKSAQGNAHDGRARLPDPELRRGRAIPIRTGARSIHRAPGGMAGHVQVQELEEDGDVRNDRDEGDAARACGRHRAEAQRHQPLALAQPRHPDGRSAARPQSPDRRLRLERRTRRRDP